MSVRIGLLSRWCCYGANLVILLVAHEQKVLLLRQIPSLRFSRMLLWVLNWVFAADSHLDMGGEHLHYVLLNQICFRITIIAFMLACPGGGRSLDDWCVLIGSLVTETAVSVMGILLRGLFRWVPSDSWYVVHRLNIKAKMIDFVCYSIVGLQCNISNSNLVHLWWVAKAVITLSRRLGVLFC